MPTMAFPVPLISPSLLLKLFEPAVNPEAAAHGIRGAAAPTVAGSAHPARALDAETPKRTTLATATAIARPTSLVTTSRFRFMDGLLRDPDGSASELNAARHR